MAPVTGSESLEPRHAGPVAGILPYLPGMHKQRARSEPGVGRKKGLMPHRSLRTKATQEKREARELKRISQFPGGTKAEYQADRSEERREAYSHRRPWPQDFAMRQGSEDVKREV